MNTNKPGEGARTTKSQKHTDPVRWETTVATTGIREMDHQQQRIQHRIYRHHHQGISCRTISSSDNDITYQSKSRNMRTSLSSNSVACIGRHRRGPLHKLMLLAVVILLWISAILWNFNHIDTSLQKQQHVQVEKQRTDPGQYGAGVGSSSSSSNQALTVGLQETTKPCFAYVFFMGACDAQHPWYRGILYNILVASYTLRSGGGGGQFDIIVLVQMSYESKETKLPQQDELLLQQFNIQIKYMNKPSHAINFYELIIQKLYVFTFTEYQRVIFLDGDIFPYCNIQYLVDLSTKRKANNNDEDHHDFSSSLLQTNVLHAMYDDPVNAGIFVIQPEAGVWEELYELFLQSQKRRQNNANSENRIGPWGSHADQLLKKSPYRLWNYYYSEVDDTNAANNNMGGNDALLSKDDGTKYNYYCSESDQGLLYYYLKFIKQDVSVIVGNTIEHYSPSSPSSTTNTHNTKGGGSVPTKRTTNNFLGHYSCLPPLPPSNMLNEILMNPTNVQATTNAALPSKYYSNPAMSMMDIETRKRLITSGFYRDFHHAVGYGKIWEQYRSRPAKTEITNDNGNVDDVLTTSDYWFWILRHVLKQVVEQRSQGQQMQLQHLRQRQQGQRGDYDDGSSLRIVSEYAESILSSLEDGTFRDKIGPPVHSVGRGDLLVVVKND